MRIGAVGENQEARIIELDGMRFFIGTLFLPQLSSSEGGPHPLIATFLKTILTFRQDRTITSTSVGNNDPDILVPMSEKRLI